MLNTIKVLGKNLNFSLNFAENLSSSGDFSKEMKDTVPYSNEEWVKNNKENIKKWIEKNSSNNLIGLDDFLIDYNNSSTLDNKSWTNLLNIMKVLGVNDDPAFKNGNNFDVKKILDKLNEFAGEKEAILNKSKGQISDLSDDVSKNIISNFKESDKRDKSKVKELQKELNRNGANLKVDGIFGKNTEKALYKIKNENATQNTKTVNKTEQTDFATQIEQNQYNSESSKVTKVENKNDDAPFYVNEKGEYVHKKTGYIFTKEEAINYLHNPEELEKMENVSTGEALYEGQVPGFMPGTTLDYRNSFSDINVASFENLLKTYSVSDIKNKILTAFNGQKVLPVSFLNPVMQHLKRYGYENKSALGTAEINTVGALLLDFVNTQERIPNMSPGNKMKILLDFNADGYINSNSNFNVNELQALKEIKTQRQFDNVLNNLGLGVDFKNEINNNYYLARKKLKTAISRFLEQKGTVANQLILDKADFDRFMNQINDSMEKEKSLEEGLKTGLLSKLEAALKEKGITNVSNEVKHQAINIMVGDLMGASVTSDSLGHKISDLTKGILDSVTFGYANGQIGIIVGGSKSFDLASRKVTVGGGFANLVPYIGINGELIKASQSSEKDLFAKSMKTGVNVKGGVNVTPLGVGTNLTIEKVNEQTAAGIETMVKNMSTNLDKMVDAISKNAGFESTGIADTPENRENFNRIEKEYKSVVNGRTALIPEFKNGILRAYQNELFENAAGNKISGITLGNLGPIVYIGPTFQRISQKYVSKNDVYGINEGIQKMYDERKKAYEEITSYSSQDKTISESFKKHLEGFDQSTLDKVNALSSKISSLIEVNEIKKLGALETSIHYLLNGKQGKDVDAVYKEFLNSMKGKDTSFLQNITTDKEKILVLQKVAINLMKKEKISLGEDGKMHIDKNKSVLEYDEAKNRKKYFDDVFRTELSDLFGDIQSAREKYYKLYGSQKAFNLKQLSNADGIGLTGVEIGSGKTKFNSLNPYVAPNIASFDNGDGKINFKPKNEKAALSQMINRFPNHLIEPMVTQLEALGYNFGGDDLQSKITKLKEIIVAGGDKDLKINNRFFFAKAGECLNDMVFMDFDVQYKKETIIPGEKINLKLMEAPNLNTYVAENNVAELTITGSKDRTKPTPPPENPPKTTPPTTPPPGTTPPTTPPPGVSTKPTETVVKTGNNNAPSPGVKTVNPNDSSVSSGTF